MAKTNPQRRALMEKAKLQRFDRPEYHWSALRVAEHRAFLYQRIGATTEAKRMEVMLVLADIWQSISIAKPTSRPSKTIGKMRDCLKKLWGNEEWEELLPVNLPNGALMSILQPTIEAVRDGVTIPKIEKEETDASERV